jgi:septal ring factor EnvC (AmiA/AmiB activator)
VSEPLTEERQRWKKAIEVLICYDEWTSASDVRGLLDEVDRLRQENDALNATLGDEEFAHQETLTLWKDSRAEVDRLRAQIDDDGKAFGEELSEIGERNHALAAAADRLRQENERLARWLAFCWPIVNAHRGRLIDRELSGTLSPAEAAQLARLQAFADEYIAFATPRPTDRLDELERAAGLDGRLP